MRLQVNSTWAYNRRVVSDTAGAPIDDTFNMPLQLRYFLAMSSGVSSALSVFFRRDKLHQSLEADRRRAISHVTLSANSVWLEMVGKPLAAKGSNPRYCVSRSTSIGLKITPNDLTDI